MYTLSFTKNAVRDLEKIEHFVRLRIINQIEKMARGEKVDIEKKKGTKNDYRLRIGDYRVIFILENKQITINKIAHRKKIYKD